MALVLDAEPSLTCCCGHSLFAPAIAAQYTLLGVASFNALFDCDTVYMCLPRCLAAFLLPSWPPSLPTIPQVLHPGVALSFDSFVASLQASRLDRQKGRHLR